MNNGMYTVKHYQPVIVTMSGGDTKEEMDVISITFLYRNGDIVIISLNSKIERDYVNLPSNILKEIIQKIKDKAAIS